MTRPNTPAEDAALDAKLEQAKRANAALPSAIAELRAAGLLRRMRPYILRHPGMDDIDFVDNAATEEMGR